MVGCSQRTSLCFHLVSTWPWLGDPNLLTFAILLQLRILPVRSQSVINIGSGLGQGRLGRRGRSSRENLSSCCPHRLSQRLQRLLRPRGRIEARVAKAGHLAGGGIRGILEQAASQGVWVRAESRGDRRCVHEGAGHRAHRGGLRVSHGGGRCMSWLRVSIASIEIDLAIQHRALKGMLKGLVMRPRHQKSWVTGASKENNRMHSQAAERGDG